MNDSLPKIPIITYNLRDRGRKFTGQPRNFDIKAIMDSINGQPTQEKIKCRGMLGYFGHKMRLLAGMEPQEGVVISGKYNEVEPAIVTTYLEAFPDGTIKHQTEFLDTEPGRKAARLHNSKVGGFSSAIDERRPEFFGFDYVFSPNYHTNRPYSLDSAGLTFDAVMAEAVAEEEEAWLALLEQKEQQIVQITAALDNATAENEQLLAMLASGQYSKETHILDSVVTKPLTVSIDATEQLRRDADMFKRTAHLPGFVKPLTQEVVDSDYETLLNGFR